MFDQIEKYKHALVLMKALGKDWREQVIFDLLVTNELDYASLSKKYVEALEVQKKDANNLLYEAECCVLEHVHDKKYSPSGREKKEIKLGKEENDHVQRSLYLLNKSGHFQMEKTNEIFGYDEEKAKELSWYERNKQ